MRRLLVTAAMVSLLLAVPVWAQMRGGRSAAPVGRFGFPFRGPVFFGGGFGHNPRFFFNSGPFFSGHRHSFFFNRSFASPFYYSSYYYPSYGGYPYPVVIQTAPPSTYYPDEYYEHGGLRRDIDVLTGKVDRLQNDVDSRMAVPRPRSSPVPEAAPQQSTVLVFKDQHIREVRNYAIVGETLWIFDEERADKIPLTDLDVDATSRLNGERGAEFHLPN